MGSVSLPPNILFGLLGIPQLQTELPGVVVVVVVSVTGLRDGVGLVPHDGVGGRVLGPGVLGSGGPQHEIFSGKNKHKIREGFILKKVKLDGNFHVRA